MPLPLVVVPGILEDEESWREALAPLGLPLEVIANRGDSIEGMAAALLERVAAPRRLSISPTAMGTSPPWAGFSQAAPRMRMARPATTQAITAVGPSIPSVAIAIPAGPAMCQPMTEAVRMFGPGAAWASA